MSNPASILKRLALVSTLAVAMSGIAPASAATPWYAGLLAAVTARGDLVLANPDTAVTVRTLISHELAPDLARAGVSISWDARAGIVYFDRSGCTVWRHDVRTGRSSRFTSGRAPVLSPDGTQLTVQSCTERSPWLGVVSTASRARTRVQRLLRSPDVPEFCCSIADVAWRPDGRALIVSIGSDFSAQQHLIDLRRPGGFIVEAPIVPMQIAAGEYVTDTEYVGNRLVIGSMCCPHWAPPSKARLAVRNPNTGALTSLFTSSRAELFVLTARPDSGMRFLRTAVNGEGAGPLWALDRLDGVPRRIGGSFRAIDW